MPIPAYDMVRANALYRAALEKATVSVFNSGQFILGDQLAGFEAGFARYCGVSHCIGTGNGLDALVLALRALDVQPGDEVIVPAFTFIATWLAAAQLGAVPVPVDVGLDGLIDPLLIPAAITPRTRAIIPVHLYGALANMEAIGTIAHDAGVAVVEDAAQAHGAERAGKRAGAFGHAAAFSFYPTKNLGALGDGGAVCTSDPALAARVRLLRNYGSTRKYEHDVRGQNSRLDELQAAYLAVKLPYLDSANRRRREIALRYCHTLGTALLSAGGPGRARFDDLPPTGIAPATFVLPHPCSSSVWHQFVLRSHHRDQLQARLASHGVGTAVHYPVAPFDQPCFRSQYDRTRYPVAARLADTVLSLPMGEYLTDSEVDHVASCLIPANPL